MAAIKCRDTGIEVKLRKELWSRGLRYRKNCREVPGKPDIVFKGAKVAIFCDSEFWHGKDWETRKDQIHSNRDYWIPKIERNIKHDAEINKKLTEMGWTVLRFWGKDIEQNTSSCANEAEHLVRKSEH